MLFKFSDGVEIETDGPFRVVQEFDGYYVAGHGMLCPVETREEGEKLIAEHSRPETGR